MNSLHPDPWAQAAVAAPVDPSALPTYRSPNHSYWTIGGFYSRRLLDKDEQDYLIAQKLV